jgi:hypothetical protein
LDKRLKLKKMFKVTVKVKLALHVIAHHGMIMKGNGESAPPILNYDVRWSVVTFTVRSIYPTKILFEVAEQNMLK